MDREEIYNKQKIREQVSTQYNSQDLDQEQNVDVNPIQYNTQNLNVAVHDNNNLGEIAGITFLERDKKILSNTKIALYYGDISKNPVYQTKTDKNGYFKIEGLPPGYYTLTASVGNYVSYKSDYIKVLTGQKVYLSIAMYFSNY
jgi:hypothetical protein